MRYERRAAGPAQRKDMINAMPVIEYRRSRINEKRFDEFDASLDVDGFLASPCSSCGNREYRGGLPFDFSSQNL